jgi:guanylate kinase
MLNKINNLKKLLGNIVIVSAPSGAGKTTICNAVIKNSTNIVPSISYTTRPPRQGEKNGKEYFFIDEKSFKKMIKEKKFVEWAKVHSNYYGTSKEFLHKTLETGKNVFLTIDVQGAVNIKKQYPQACMIFIMPPDLKTLEERLKERNKDCEKSIKLRLNNVKQEIKYLKNYEYLVINQNLNKAVNAVKTIIKSLEYKIVKNQKYYLIDNRR